MYDKNVDLPASADGTPGPKVEIGDSDFLVGLSALSSMSTTTTTTQSAPLDIVLVLDTSSSMDENIVTPAGYVPTYDVDYLTNDYYAKVENRYERIERVYEWSFPVGSFHWELDGVEVTPLESASDTPTDTHIQFYEYNSSGRMTRLEALQIAANAFIDQAVAENAQIADPNRRHQVALVSFSDEGNLRRELTPCTSANASRLKSSVNSLRAWGNTYPGRAMDTAKQALQGSREGAQKVVIFFTDGNPAPSGSDEFNLSMANDGITGALELKNNKALIYSVGVFDDADPKDTKSDFNAYMNSMSSNYPKASGGTGNRVDNRTWDLGDRAKGDYYFAATTSDELYEIFEKIYEAITQATGSPTEVGSGDPAKSGYITFTDQLGDYMKVDAFKSIVFADEVFNLKEKTTEGMVDTYHFEGAASEGAGTLYPEDANLNSLVIKVTRSNDIAVGDLVEVQVPAALIPLRKFDVYPEGNSEGKTSGVSNTWPIRIYFGVSPKDGVSELVAEPDDKMLDYIANNMTTDGKVAFYTNSWTAGDPGDTIANFTPAEGNSYYYFIEDTPIYSDADCTQRVQGRLNNDDTVYHYKRTFYDVSSGHSVEQTAYYSFKGNSAVAVNGAVAYDREGYAYFTAGAPRLTYIDELSHPKDVNLTGTGTDVINPSWNNEEEADEATQINVSLGNNGRLDVELPGALSVKKTLELPEGYDPADFETVDFTFNVTLKKADGSALSGNIAAAVEDASGKKTEATVALDSNGAGSFELKSGETMYLYGLPAGATYVVSEVLPADSHFTVDVNQAEGDIAAGEVSDAAFVNTYNPKKLEVKVDQLFKAQKVLTGRSWEQDDSFEIDLRAEGTNAPMPDEGTINTGSYRYKPVKVTNKDEADNVQFGDIVFEAPGVYQYTVSEYVPNNRIPGITYTDAIYRVWVYVEDVNGGLQIDKVEMKQTYDDNGQEIENPVIVANNVAVFENTYSASSVNAAPTGKKTLTKGQEHIPLTTNQFGFKVTILQDNTPVPGGRADAGTVRELGHAANGDILFGRATFDATDLNNTYVYRVEEKIPENAFDSTLKKTYKNATDAEKASGTWKLNGIVYDTNVWKASVTINEKILSDNTVILDPVWTYSYSNDTETDVVAPDMEFKNTYQADDATLDDTNMIKGSKHIDGRGFNANETFGFSLGAADDATRAAIDAGKVTDLATSPVSVDIQDGEFNFGAMKFTEEGTYNFLVTETHWNDAAIDTVTDKKGMEFDDTVYEVTVTVEDNNGQLEAETTYAVQGDAAASPTAADFTNTYSASTSYGDEANGGLPISKTLNGRDMAAREFEFSIKGVKSDSVEADEAEGRLADRDRTFYNGAALDGTPWTTGNPRLQDVTFTNADAGRTFSYLVDEVESAGDDAKPGMTYDKSEFRVDITVADNGEGDLSVSTAITRVKDAKGDPADEDVTQTGVAFVNTYAPGSVEHDFDTDGSAALYKQLTGRDWKNGNDDADEFTFTVTPGQGSPVPDGENGAYEVTVSGKGEDYKDGDRVPFSIGTITFDAAGEYTYTVTENKGSIPGIKYSDHSVTLTVTVSDNTATGELEVTGVTLNGTRTFENEYTSTVNYADAVNFSLSKTLHGRAMDANQFNFTLTAGSQEAADKLSLPYPDAQPFAGPSKAGADGEEVFMRSAVNIPLEFDLADSGDTFTYTFQEVPDTTDAGKGYTFDSTVYELSITPADNGNGGMDVKTVLKTTKDGKTETKEFSSAAGVAEADRPVVTLPFVNEYKPLGFEGVPTNFTLRKVLDGKKWGANDSFSFVLKSENGAPMPADAAEGGTKTVAVSAKTGIDSTTGNDYADFNFGEIVYDKATPADQPWVYTVTEVDGGHDGYTYSKNTAKIEVRVTDEDGQLSAVATVQNSTFTNAYKAELNYTAHGGVTITKRLDGRNMAAGDFGFLVTPDSVEAAKLLDELANNTNPFNYQSPNANIGEVATVYQVFEDVVFDQDDIGNTYEYTITEKPTNNPAYTCTSGDTFIVVIEVADAGDGHLKATTTVKNEDTGVVKAYEYVSGVTTAKSATVDFVNEYKATPAGVGGEGQSKIAAWKTLYGRDMVAGEFGFEIRNVTDGKNIFIEDGVNTAASDGKANVVAFDPITYTSETLAKDLNEGNVKQLSRDNSGAIVYEYTYRVSEVSGFGGDTGVTQGDSSFEVKVQVKDDNKGKITIDRLIYPDASNDQLNFTNYYGKAAEGMVSLNGSKAYTVPQGDGYQVPDITGKFNFTLTGSDGAPMPDGTVDGTKTVTNDAAGNVTFGNIRYTMENVFGAPVTADVDDAAVTTEDGAEATAGAQVADDAARASKPRTKTFTYTVTERGSVAGVTNDPVSTREVRVTVTDNGDGTISVARDPETGMAFTFTNSYTVNPGGGSLTGDGGFKISKQLKGRALAEGEFEFALTDAAGNVVASAKNAADGTVTMPNVTFDKPGVYKYKLSEVAGKLGGVTYDTTVYDVTATVEHPGADANALTVEWTVDGHKAGDELTFVNTYEAGPTSIVFNAAKVLKGRDLKDGEFEFTLSENGKVLQTVKNDANGQIAFECIEFTEPGEHEYVIAEVKGDVKGVTYDDAKYTVKVSVTDGGKGLLLCDWAYGEAGAPVFTNVYAEDKEPPKPEPPKTDGDKGDKETLPATGDASMLLAVPAIAGAAATAAGIYTSKRKRNRS